MSGKTLSLHQILQQCTIRVSSRAKYMRLSVSTEKGIEVVIPGSMTQNQANKLIPQFVKDKQIWINQTIEKFQQRRLCIPSLDNCPLPTKIHLKALDQILDISYQTKVQGATKLVKQDNQLIVCGSMSESKVVFALLETYLKAYAKPFIQNNLEQLSQQFNLHYNRVTIRAQKTRWGSCSAKRNISLNYRLLFLDRALMEYILLHELAHTVHLNHSKAFWSLLESMMPDARQRDKEVNQMANQLPCWVYL